MCVALPDFILTNRFLYFSWCVFSIFPSNDLKFRFLLQNTTHNWDLLWPFQFFISIIRCKIKYLHISYSLWSQNMYTKINQQCNLNYFFLSYIVTHWIYMCLILCFRAEYILIKHFHMLCSQNIMEIFFLFSNFHNAKRRL